METTNGIELLKTTFVDSFPKHSKATNTLLTIDIKATVYEAVTELLKSDFRSAPIYDSDKKVYEGLFDFIDLNCFLIKVYEENPDATIEEKQKIFFQSPVREIANFSARNPYIPISPESTVFEAMENLGKGCRRIVTEKDGVIQDIISQSTVIQFISQHIQAFAPSLNRKISDVKLGLFELVSCDANEPAFNAFQKMVKGKITAVPIVSDNAIISIITCRDIKLCFIENTLECLNLSCEDFVAQIRRLNYQQEKYPYFVVGPDSTYEKALLKLVATKVQRLYVINSEKTPIGVITLRELINIILNQH